MSHFALYPCQFDAAKVMLFTVAFTANTRGGNKMLILSFEAANVGNVILCYYSLLEVGQCVVLTGGCVDKCENSGAKISPTDNNKSEWRRLFA